MVQKYSFLSKKAKISAVFRAFIWFFVHLFVPLQPLFGVIAGRKHRVACYVALERYSKQVKSKRLKVKSYGLN
jgi:hypothetical protein